MSPLAEASRLLFPANDNPAPTGRSIDSARSTIVAWHTRAELAPLVAASGLLAYMAIRVAASIHHHPAAQAAVATLGWLALGAAVGLIIGPFMRNTDDMLDLGPYMLPADGDRVPAPEPVDDWVHPSIGRRMRGEDVAL